MSNIIKTGLGSFVGRRMSKSVSFLDGKITIYKLSAAQVEEMRASAEAAADGSMDDFALLHMLFSVGCEGGEDMTLEEVKSLPLEEIKKLAEAIYAWSGLGSEEKKA
jgi:hypothetical protein